ncbi:MAG: hypothetical protein EXS49_00875 [Candidatus Pacebacteria bacterium]|nr:hypothetical protein [Candidatus Paceibacterota bacterium]
MRKYILFGFLITALVFLVREAKIVYNQRQDLGNHFSELQSSYDDIKNRNDKLANTVEAMKDPEFREKILKSNSNYRKSDEKLYIVVPSKK